MLRRSFLGTIGAMLPLAGLFRRRWSRKYIGVDPAEGGEDKTVWAICGKTYPPTLMIVDEASGIDDAIYDSSDEWAHRKLIISSPRSGHNFFKPDNKDKA